MHFAFIPYGKRSEVELLFRDMEAQKHYLKMTKGDSIIQVPIQSAVRLLPFGVVEYVFPREDLDIVLNTLIEEENRYNIPKFIIRTLRKILRLKPIPKFKKEKKYLWVREHVNFIFLGIREDIDIVDDMEQYRGYTHEAI